MEAYNCIFNVTEKINKFELCTDNFDEFSFAQSKDELEEILSISNITPSYLQHGIIEPRNIQTSKKPRSKKSSADGCVILLLGYARSQSRDFESYLRIVVGSVEDDIQTLKYKVCKL